MKQLHKRIGQHVRRFPRHFTKYLYERDTIFATIWVFIFIIVLGSIPLNLSVLNPLKLALKDFDISDISYSDLDKDAEYNLDSNIVIINIGHADREGLSLLIDKTASYDPQVIGLDVVFEGPHEDPYKDSLTRTTIAKHKNLVITNRIDWDDVKEPLKGQYFSDVTTHKGYANLVGDSKTERNSIRLFSAFEKINGTVHNSFPAALVKEYDEKAFRKLEKRHKPVDVINYSRHINQYRIVEGDSLLLGLIVPDYIKGKIALLGYISHDPNDIEDKVFTPMNEKFVGKSIPDMNGIVVHANIISMILEDNYVNKLPSWANWLIAIFLCWLHMSFFIRYYLENHIWFHLVAKLAQVFSIILFSYLAIALFDWFNIKLDMKYSLVVIILAVDVIYFYEAFAVWMHKKYHYHTVFHQKHH